jgi:hypothetical protein
MVLTSLHTRHSALLESTASSIYDAARVAMARFHEPEELTWNVSGVGGNATYDSSWEAPTSTHFTTFANEKDTTEDAAYCVAIATADCHLDLELLTRAPQGSGSDWIFGSRGAKADDGLNLDFESVELMRLEVSGISEDTPNKLEARVRQKVAQTQGKQTTLPATAAVVGFKSASVRLRRA